jgi:protein arginine kinase activator
MTLAEFKQRGRFGCANDYEVFSAHIDPLLERIHDAQPPQHRGRLPRGLSDSAATDKAREVAALQDQLDHAVLSEDYERAAQLRDRLSQLTGVSARAKAKSKKAGK